MSFCHIASAKTFLSPSWIGMHCCDLKMAEIWGEYCVWTADGASLTSLWPAQPDPVRFRVKFALISSATNRPFYKNNNSEGHSDWSACLEWLGSVHVPVDLLQQRVQRRLGLRLLDLLHQLRVLRHQCRRSASFCRSLGKMKLASGWLRCRCWLRAWRMLSWISSTWWTFMRPGRSTCKHTNFICAIMHVN